MYSRYKRQWILHFARMGYKPPTICHMLREESLIANRMWVHMFLQKHRVMNNIERRPGSGRPTKMTVAVKALIEQQIELNWIEFYPRGERVAGRDDETTTVQLHALATPWFWRQASGVALLWAGRSEAVPIASWFARKIKWSVSSWHRNISAME